MLEFWAPNIKPEEVGRRGRGQEEKEEVESVVTDGKEKERTLVFHQNRMWEVIVLADGNRHTSAPRDVSWNENLPHERRNTTTALQEAFLEQILHLLLIYIGYDFFFVLAVTKRTFRQTLRTEMIYKKLHRAIF